MAEIEMENKEELEYGADDFNEAITMEVVGLVNVREEPSLNAHILGTLEPGKKVHVFEEENDWIKHETGWSMKIYFK